ncbi:restriction endonuclease subunit S [Campylobacter concisus]|jgi:putative type I restriction enzyme specificity protein|uniref:restriction endonuclease subunit S n=1 Tax=Campylobacter concisus TaxID=199 RepID=UPI003D2443E2
MSEFKNLPSGWKVVRLGDIAEKSILKNRNNLIKLVLSNSAIDGLVAQNEYFDKDIANKENIQDYYIVDLGDFVYNPRISQSAPTGPINRNMLSKGIVSPLYTVFTVQDEILAKFLAYFFKTIVWQNQVKSVANYGARYDRINITDNAFFSLKILLPPLDEQEKIAEILSTWDEAINLTINLIESKKQFKKALMQNLLTAKICFPQFKDEWKETKLGEICEIQTGKLNANAMIQGGRYKFFTCAKEVFEIDDYAFDTEAILISGNGENVGYIHYFNGKFNAYQRTYVLDKFTENILFIKHFLEFALKRKIEIEKKDGNTPYIVLSTIFDFIVKLPNLKEQQKIAEVLTACDDEINLLNLKLENLKKQKQGLMQKLLKGEMRTCYVKKAM